MMLQDHILWRVFDIILWIVVLAFIVHAAQTFITMEDLVEQAPYVKDRDTLHQRLEKLERYHLE